MAQALRLVLVGLLFGWFYAWAAPRFYPREGKPGFALGMLHGALMPMALPSLLLGKDVPIYASKNLGRRYKVGYIAGINVCGFLFFGLAFMRPPRRGFKTSGSGARESHRPAHRSSRDSPGTGRSGHRHDR